MSKLDKFLAGEWEDTDTVCEALHISFAQGMAIFEFSRTAEWLPEPYNGQKITTKFKLKRELRVGDTVQSTLYDTRYPYCPPAGCGYKGRVVAINKKGECAFVMWDATWPGMSPYVEEFASAKMARAFWTKIEHLEIVKDGEMAGC